MPQAYLPTSPYCTIGPFFPGSFAQGCEDLTSVQGKRAQGQHIELTGQIFEEGQRPIQNAVIEIWQPDANGIFRHPLDPRFAEADPGFFGWGRVRTDRDGRYSFRTVLPGSSRGRAPHINLMILAIGLTRRLVTTVFFDASDSVRDPVLDAVADPRARARMFARREALQNGTGPQNVYHFDIVTRGESETPFFID